MSLQLPDSSEIDHDKWDSEYQKTITRKLIGVCEDMAEMSWTHHAERIVVDGSEYVIEIRRK